MPTSRSSSTARAARLALAHLQMDDQRLHDLLSDRQDRIERGHRLLEDHRDVAAAHLAHLLVGEIEQVAALEQDAARGDAAGRLGSSRMIASADTDLPQPDSPTIATVSPALTVYEMPSTARTMPREVSNRTCRFSTSSRGAFVLSGDARSNNVSTPAAGIGRSFFLISGCVAIADRPANSYPNRHRIDGRHGRGGAPGIAGRRN